jgi:hypothetical protein
VLEYLLKNTPKYPFRLPFIGVQNVDRKEKSGWLTMKVREKKQPLYEDKYEFACPNQATYSRPTH